MNFKVGILVRFPDDHWYYHTRPVWRCPNRGDHYVGSDGRAHEAQQHIAREYWCIRPTVRAVPDARGRLFKGQHYVSTATTYVKPGAK